MEIVIQPHAERKPLRRPHRLQVGLDQATWNRLQALSLAEGLFTPSQHAYRALQRGLRLLEAEIAAQQSQGMAPESSIAFCDFRSEARS